MKPSIKATIGGLLALALVSVFLLSSSLRERASAIVSFNLPKLESPKYDEDGDGLDNKDEIYWNTDPLNPDTDGDGFLDGEEVLSGRNPAKPAPDDSLEDVNLTDKFSEMAAIGMVEGSLKSDNPGRDEMLTNINLSVIEEAVAGFEARLFRTPIIEVENKEANVKKYFENLNPILTDFLVMYVNESTFIYNNISGDDVLNFSDPGISKEISKYKSRSSDIVSRLSRLEVPENIVEAHRSILRIAINIEGINIAFVGGANDPLKSSIAMNRFIGYYKIVGDSVASLSKLAQDNNFKTAGTIFQR